MTTTLVRDSIVGDDWIRQTVAAVPVQRLLDSAGQPTGDILTGPVRLCFVDSLFDKENDKDSEDVSYSVLMMFTPLFDPRIFYEEYYAFCSREFPQYYDAPTQQYNGLVNPFKDQAEKTRYGGFTPGCVMMNSGSKFKPPIVDTRFNPIVDKSKVYAGVWAICSVKPYPYGKAGKTKDGKPMKKGIGFGLQSIMIIADDTRLGGGAPDPREQFAGVKVSAPIVRPDVAQGMPAFTPPAPAAGIPGYTVPGGGVPAPGMPQQGFSMPQTTYTPPAPQGFTPPGAPVTYAGVTPGPQTYASPATTYPIETEDQRMMREMGLA